MQNKNLPFDLSKDQIFQKLIDNNTRFKEEDKILIRRAFDLAYDVHKTMKRVSGEPFIFHPVEVARIVTKEIGLGKTAAICALLHDVIDNSEITAEDIRDMFGEKVGYICSGLAKLPESEGTKAQIQAENFRKLLLTLSDDVRVIFIKLAERLHNMRTIFSLPQQKQEKMARQTLELYSPLAHRMGVYKIKTELEELCFKILHPVEFEEISQKLVKSEKQRIHLINKFSMPLNLCLIKKGVKYNLSGRTKSIYSIWNKMQTKNVPFEEVYDVLAIRIVFDPKLNEPEDLQCFAIYREVIQMYWPMPERLRDWVTKPKDNGYEALHITVKGPENRWVEVQIRTRRMDELAELGFAAHHKYKGVDSVESTIDKWIKKMKSVLENPDLDALRFIDKFKLNMFSSEIYVFTPKGEIKSLPQHSTVLDFAFQIHSALGTHCLGAQINQKIVPPNHVLLSGDSVKIITSSKETTKPEWLEFVVTQRAHEKIEEAIFKKKKSLPELGKEILVSVFEELKIQPSSAIIKDLIEKYNSKSKSQLYLTIGKGDIAKENLAEYLKKFKKKKFKNYWMLQFTKSLGFGSKQKPEIEKTAISSIEFDQYESKPALCCNPIPGDEVIGVLENNETIWIHKIHCPIAAKTIDSDNESFVEATWKAFTLESFLVKIKLQGLDKRGLVYNLSTVIYRELRVSMKAFHIDTENGIFDCVISVYVHNIDDLHHLMANIKKIEGVKTVERIEEIDALNK